MNPPRTPLGQRNVNRLEQPSSPLKSAFKWRGRRSDRKEADVTSPGKLLRGTKGMGTTPAKGAPLRQMSKADPAAKTKLGGGVRDCQCELELAVFNHLHADTQHDLASRLGALTLDTTTTAGIDPASALHSRPTRKVVTTRTFIAKHLGDGFFRCAEETALIALRRVDPDRNDLSGEPGNTADLDWRDNIPPTPPIKQGSSPFVKGLRSVHHLRYAPSPLRNRARARWQAMRSSGEAIR